MRTISLYEIFKADTIRNRNSVILITDQISKYNSEKIIIDFSNIEFISRSFANELQTRLKDIDFEFRNTSTIVKRMLEVSIEKPKFDHEIKIQRKKLLAS